MLFRSAAPMNSEKEIQGYLERITLTEDETQALYNLARAWAERVTCTIEEIAEKIAYLVQKTAETLVDIAGTILEELEKAISDIETEPRVRRRKAERDRARRIEQRYRAEIRRCERERPYRRIYKPP